MENSSWYMDIVKSGDCCWILYFQFGECKYETAYFFKSWSRILYSVSPIKSCIEYLAAFNALFIKPYYIHDTGSRLQASLPSWCSKRLVRHSKIHIYHYYTSFFFYFTHHDSHSNSCIIFSLLQFFFLYLFLFFPCWSKVNWIGKHSLNCKNITLLGEQIFMLLLRLQKST
jgi:hypothetical protein